MKFFYQISLIKPIILTIFITSSMLFKECQSNEFYIMIKDFCLDELRREMRIAGKDFNDELGDFTCNCFFNKIQSGESLILARRTCKEEVSKKYKL